MARPTDLKTVIASGSRVARPVALDRPDLDEIRLRHEALIDGGDHVARLRHRCLARVDRHDGGPSEQLGRQLDHAEPVRPDPVDVRSRPHPCRVEHGLRRGRRAADDVRLAHRRLGVRRGLDVDARLIGHPARECLAAFGLARVHGHPTDRPRGEHGPDLPLRLGAGADDGEGLGIGPREEPGADPRGGTGAHGRDRSAVEDGDRAAGAGVEPHDQRMDGRQAQRRVPGHDRHELDAGAGPALAHARHEQQGAIRQPDVRAQRRSIPAAGHVAVGGLDRVEQVGCRHAPSNRVAVDEGKGVGHHRSWR